MWGFDDVGHRKCGDVGHRQLVAWAMSNIVKSANNH